MSNVIRALTKALAICLFAVPVSAGPILYTHDGAGNLGTVDVSTGTATVIGDMGVQLTDIAFDPFGNLFGLSFTNFYSIDETNANLTLIGAHGIDGGNALVFRADGTLYAAGSGNNSLYTVNAVTGTSTNLGNMGFSSAGDLAFYGGSFYLSAETAGNDRLVSIDLGNLSNTSAVGSFGFDHVFGLATGSDGVLYGLSGTQIFSVNTTTGAGTFVSDYSGSGLGEAFGSSFFEEATSVPEPSSLFLLSTGLALVSARGRRKTAV